MLGNIERLIWKNVYKNVTGAQFITLKTTGDTAFNEVKNISDWANENRMILNFSKTWLEIVISKGSLKLLPPPIATLLNDKIPSIFNECFTLIK